MAPIIRHGRWVFAALFPFPDRVLPSAAVQAIISEFGEGDHLRNTGIEYDLQAACLNYRLPDHERKRDLAGRRRRLAQISSSAQRLLNALKPDDEDAAKLFTDWEINKFSGNDQLERAQLTPPIALQKDIQEKWSDFRELLGFLSSEAGSASRDTERLLSLRGTEKQTNAKKPGATLSFGSRSSASGKIMAKRSGFRLKVLS